jgi:hypothetical protein
MSITVEAIRTLPDDELDRLIAEAVEEKKTRTEREKQATIAKIKELAGAVGVRIAIGGARGRPVKARAHGNGNHKKAEATNGNAAMAVKKAG